MLFGKLKNKNEIENLLPCPKILYAVKDLNIMNNKNSAMIPQYTDKFPRACKRAAY